MDMRPSILTPYMGMYAHTVPPYMDIGMHTTPSLYGHLSPSLYGHTILHPYMVMLSSPSLYGHVLYFTLFVWTCLCAYFNPVLSQQADGQQAMPMPPLQVMKPNELFYSKIIPLLKENGLSEQTPRKEWPHHIQLRVLKELIAETPADLLARLVT